MPADDRLGPVRALALVLAILGALLGSACSGLGSTSLTREEIDRRAQEYFSGGQSSISAANSVRPSRTSGWRRPTTYRAAIPPSPK